MSRRAIVIGSGPNGLSAAIVLAQAGLDVEVREAASVIGGGTRSGELTLPGFTHDLGSAVYPMAVSSPFFTKLHLENYGLKWIWSPAELAHPLDDGTAVIVERNVAATAEQFPPDADAYREIFNPLVERWGTLFAEVFRPLRLPAHPLLLALLGVRGIQPAVFLAKSSFRTQRARALFAGQAAHSKLKLEAPLSSAFGLIMGASAHATGWPIPQGGAQQIANALSSVLSAVGGSIVTNSPVRSLNELPPSDLVLCDITPRQFLAIADGRLNQTFSSLLEQYRYGPGVFKVDWALREPIPWRAKECLLAATVHVGGTLEEIADSERSPWQGRVSRRPFVLLVQPSLFDPTRAPSGRHTAWAYCEVPNGYTGSALEEIEQQVERFAPGFRECVLARAIHGPPQLERWNQNLVGGDVGGGSVELKQLFLRPTWRRYRTPLEGVYLCSSSTPPGGAVHGMCGYYAAQWALADLRKKRKPSRFDNQIPR